MFATFLPLPSHSDEVFCTVSCQLPESRVPATLFVVFERDRSGSTVILSLALLLAIISMGIGLPFKRGVLRGESRRFGVTTPDPKHGRPKGAQENGILPIRPPEPQKHLISR